MVTSFCCVMSGLPAPSPLGSFTRTLGGAEDDAAFRAHGAARLPPAERSPPEDEPRERVRIRRPSRADPDSSRSSGERFTVRMNCRWLIVRLACAAETEPATTVSRTSATSDRTGFTPTLRSCPLRVRKMRLAELSVPDEYLLQGFLVVEVRAEVELGRHRAAVAVGHEQLEELVQWEHALLVHGQVRVPPLPRVSRYVT